MYDIKELSSGLSLDVVMFLFDNVEEVTVDTNYLLRILRRLRTLEEKLPEHLAEADIPDTLKFIKKVLPEKLQKLI